MRYRTLFFVSLFILFVSISAHSKVRLTDVTTLTLQRGQYTQGRRNAGVPQLRCVGGSAQGQYAPAVVQCYNKGSDGTDVQWECRASMPKEYEFGRISVTCEGYEYPDDPFILAGSCGLEYELNVAPVGSAQYAKRHPSAPFENDETSFSWTGIVYFGIACFVMYLLYLTLSGPRPGYEGDRDQRGGGYPGGGGGGGHPPGGPPPPGFRAYPPSYDEATKGTHTTSSAPGTSSTNTGQTGGGPGFFTGLGLGALGGYFYGNSGNNAGATHRRRGYGWGGGQTQFDRDTGFGSSSSSNYQSYQTSAPSSSGSASRHTSTSFGGTTRR